MTGCADSEELRKRLLHEAGVAVLADIHFGRRVPGDGQHIRFSYAASPEAIRNGVERLDVVHPHEHAMTDAARDNVLRRVRARARRARRSAIRAAAAAQAYIAAHASGPASRAARRPGCAISCSARPTWTAPSSASRTRTRSLRPSRATSTRWRCLPALAAQKSRRGVCWPEFADARLARAPASKSSRDRRPATIASASRVRFARSPRPARWSC